jgi:hypothetical protein
MDGIKWLPIQGNILELDGVIKYTGTMFTENNVPRPPELGIIRSNIPFSNGEISLEVKLHGQLTEFSLALGFGVNLVCFSLAKGQHAYSLLTWSQSTQILSPINFAGEQKNLIINEWLKVKVKVVGSEIHCSVNDVPVLIGNTNVAKSELALTFFGMSDVEVRNISVSTVRPTAFTVMQFSKEYDELYNNVIESVCDEFGIKAVRADDIHNNGMVIHDIVREISEAQLVIADITPNNPNVYYEVGYAHAKQKQVILLCDRSRSELPFDLSSFRTIFYENSISGKVDIEQKLRKHLDNLFPIN